MASVSKISFNGYGEDDSDIFNFMKSKYFFSEMNKQSLKNVIEDVSFLDKVYPLNDNAEDSLIKAKEFLSIIIKNNQHLIEFEKESAKE